MRRIMIAAGLALSGVLLVGGCQFGGGGGSNKKHPGKAAAPSSATVSPAASAAGPPAKKSVTYAALANGGTVTVGFQNLQVRGKLAVLSLTWTPRVPAGYGKWDVSQMSDGGEISLVDTKNLKRYVIVSDSDHNVLGSSGNGDQGDLQLPKSGPKAQNGQTVSTTYTYAAPPPDVTAIDVYAEQRLLFSVPITR